MLSATRVNSVFHSSSDRISDPRRDAIHRSVLGFDGIALRATSDAASPRDKREERVCDERAGFA